MPALEMIDFDFGLVNAVKNIAEDRIRLNYASSIYISLRMDTYI